VEFDINRAAIYVPVVSAVNHNRWVLRWLSDGNSQIVRKGLFSISVYIFIVLSSGIIFHILIHFYCLVAWLRSLADSFFEEGNTFTLLQINSNWILYVPCLMQQDRKLGVLRNMEARSCNRCYSGKAINITYSECVFVALRNPGCSVHAPYCSSVACPALQYFSTLSHKRR
jgi:hypothetical protein